MCISLYWQVAMLRKTSGFRKTRFIPSLFIYVLMFVLLELWDFINFPTKSLIGEPVICWPHMHAAQVILVYNSLASSFSLRSWRLELIADKYWPESKNTIKTYVSLIAFWNPHFDLIFLFCKINCTLCKTLCKINCTYCSK